MTKKPKKPTLAQRLVAQLAEARREVSILENNLAVERQHRANVEAECKELKFNAEKRQKLLDHFEGHVNAAHASMDALDIQRQGFTKANGSPQNLTLPERIAFLATK